MTQNVTMSFTNYVSSISILLLFSLTTVVCDTCVKDGDCKCSTSSGTVDLSKIDLLISTATSTKKFMYTPCKAYSTKCGDFDSDIAICQEEKSFTYAVGKISTATFSGEPNKNLQLEYNAKSSDIARIGIVKIICDKDVKTPQFKYIEEKPTGTYKFTLTSEYGCLICHGLSVGSVLLIVFFVCVVLYLVCGVLFLKFVRGATGVELIPSLEFWKGLPSLIFEGCLFVKRGCKSDASYDAI